MHRIEMARETELALSAAHSNEVAGATEYGVWRH